MASNVPSLDAMRQEIYNRWLEMEKMRMAVNGCGSKGGHGGVGVSIGQAAVQAAAAHSHSLSSSQLPPHAHSNPTPWVDMYGQLHLVGMIAMRLHLRPGDLLPFEFIQAHKGKDNVFVFVIHKGEPVVLKDDPHMYPSDELMGKLRLLAG